MTTGRLAALASSAAVALVAAAGAPQQAGAWWRSIAPTRSVSAPFRVCPPAGRSVRCALIEDPTPASRVRGPVPAGAITRGPEQEVSPALSGHGEDGGYSPAELRSAYELPSATAGTGQTVAVVEAYNDPDAEADLAEYRSKYLLSSCNAASGCIRQVNQRGQPSLPSPNVKWAEETSFDLDMVSAICPNCHILVVEAENAEGENIKTAEDEAVTLGATEISDSFAQSTPLEPQEAAAYDHPGIPIAVAAGDDGYGVVWPAASPSVIAVGGTTLEAPATGRAAWTETAWSKTGGGCSAETKPAWQTDTGCAGRTTNDVAAVADPNTPVSAYDSYETHGAPWLLAGGTSVAAPIVAAAMALASPYSRSFDGAQSLYLERANGVEGFYDVRSGGTGSCHPTTYLCEAGIGYDGPTGLGGLRGAPDVPPPAPATGAASAATTTEATLNGTVNPHGVSLTTCRFKYRPSSALEWTSKPCSASPGAVVTPVEVATTLTGLAPGAAYEYLLAVSYPGGSAESDGEVLSFTMPSAQPSVLSQSGSSLTPTSAALGATIDPGGAAVEECWFEYGQGAPGYGSFAYCTTKPGGNSPVEVSATATALQPNTTYHFRVYVRTGTSPGHEVRGVDQTVRTLTLAPTPTTLPASAIGSDSATLNATVDPNGATVTSCEFEFGSGTGFVPCSPEPGSGESPVAVSASLAGLSPSTRYLYRVLATNAGGSAYGAIGELTTAEAPPTSGNPEEPVVSSTPPLTEDPLDPLTTPPVAAAGGSIASCAAHLASTALYATASGAVKLTLLCTTEGVERHGTITLLMSNGAGSGPRSSSQASTALATASYAVPAGGVAAIVLHLSARARHLLAAAHLLHARVVIGTRPPLPASTSTASVTLRARRAAAP